MRKVTGLLSIRPTEGVPALANNFLITDYPELQAFRTRDGTSDRRSSIESTVQVPKHKYISVKILNAYQSPQTVHFYVSRRLLKCPFIFTYPLVDTPPD
jgi:hypothetical protein